MQPILLPDKLLDGQVDLLVKITHPIGQVEVNSWLNLCTDMNAYRLLQWPSWGRGYLPRGRGYLPMGVCRGGYLPRGRGVCLGEVSTVGGGAVQRILDTRLWKHYLSATNVADGKYMFFRLRFVFRSMWTGRYQPKCKQRKWNYRYLATRNQYYITRASN